MTNNLKYKEVIKKIFDYENYDFLCELDCEEIADNFSEAFAHLRQGKRIFNIDDCSGYKIRIVNNSTFSNQPSCYIAVSNEVGEALSDMCYPFWNKYNDEDEEYFLETMLSAFNEAYCRLVTACI